MLINCHEIQFCKTHISILLSLTTHSFLSVRLHIYCIANAEEEELYSPGLINLRKKIKSTIYSYFWQLNGMVLLFIPSNKNQHLPFLCTAGLRLLTGWEATGFIPLSI